jgi:hypothetical protein
VQTDPARELDTLLHRVRAALDGAAPEADPGEPFQGEAAEGRIRAEVAADGHLHALHLDPTVLREPLTDIASAIVLAVNAALDARPARADARPLLAELQAVQEESVVQMQRISQAFAAALAQARSR